ncbi:hypothetical protein CBE01nite_29530 [Clostridium beijerinckii]|uniref:Uncharacterized protein n=1 Tax=Clostridium beijerinckii TaxID=1520 RepID=A0AB74VD98_CLOBE|nr:hypothetical protein [Clostridium beijerinckii]NRZ28733.1 hypothetical protein [Clostridium beijerinckii]NYB95491.1 hypothetical protein [Clostridium beijerinckii]OOM19485.1 hypothetical protein CLBEI_50110 [Clostridium beijerinckii]QUN34411.1 hypothetical protein KEC93_21180 [Clostridium beijerinckii]SQB00634.1 Uncharacterised protein [Clostridium beijerinckii]
MFDLDLKVFYFFYSHCKVLGSIFGFGAFEGAIMYISVIALAIVKVNEAKKVKK